MNLGSSITTVIPVTGDRVVRGTIELPPEGTESAPIILFIPGFKGFRDWGGWPMLTRAIADAGFIVHRLDLSMNGFTGRSQRHDEPEKFAKNTFAHDLEDLDVVLDCFDRWPIPRGLASDRLGIIGHSRGGVVSLLFAGENPAIEAVATLGAPAQGYRVFREEQHQQWREQGYLEIPNARTGQILQLDVSVLEDFEANAERYDVEASVTSMPTPTLVVHGTEDETVPLGEAQQLVQWISDDFARLVTLETGHTFGYSHPQEDRNPLESVLAQHLIDWFVEEFSE